MKFSFALAILTQAVNIAAATTTPKDCSNTNEWDAVVVGAGLSGSIIASKLATDAPDKCVLVVEGGKESGQIIDAEDASVVKSNNEFFEKGWGAVHTSPETVWNTPGAYDNGNFVCYGQDCDYVWGKDGTNTPGGLVAGKVVGGSGAINGALMQYPPDNNWEPYPDGWKAGDMKKYLDEIHSTMNASSFPSTDGMHYNDERGANQVREAMKAQGFLASEDAAYWKPFGGTMGIPKVTTVGGRRSSSTSMYLKPALENNSNIQLWTETTVTKIELDKSNVKAIGLNIKRNGEEEKIVLAKDGLVVVSGGGVKTPQLLLESGIGPGLKVPNDAVGKGLTDKTISWVKYNVKGVEKYNIDPPSKEDQDLFVKEGKGPLTQFGPLLVGMIDIDPEVTNDPDKKRKNVVEFFVPAAKDDDIVGVYFVHLTPKKGNGVGAVISIHEDGVVRTDNWGDQWDGDYGTKSTNAAIDVVTKAMENMGYTSAPGGEPWLHPMNHPGGTCGLDTCIDSRTLLVKGLENVAVCDNSIVPEQAIVHTAFSLMAMALRGADILKDFWKVEVVPILEEQKDEL